MSTSRSITKRLGAAGAAGILVLTLTACGTIEDTILLPTSPSKEIATPQQQPVEKRSVEPLEVSVGDIVGVVDSQRLPEGQAAYPLENGDLIAVDVGEELPDRLVDEIRSLVVPSDKVYDHFLKTGEGNTTAAWNKGNDIGEETGRHFVIISEVASYDKEGEPDRWYWGAIPTGDAYAANRSDEGFGSPTLEHAIDKAEDYIATSEYPDAYELIIIE